MTQPVNTNRPVDELRIGRVKATIWRNETEDGKARFNTVFSRLYKDGDAWQSTPSFGRNDLLLVAKVADLAHTRVCELSGKDNAALLCTADSPAAAPRQSLRFARFQVSADTHGRPLFRRARPAALLPGRIHFYGCNLRQRRIHHHHAPRHPVRQVWPSRLNLPKLSHTIPPKNQLPPPQGAV